MADRCSRHETSPLRPLLPPVLCTLLMALAPLTGRGADDAPEQRTSAEPRREPAPARRLASGAAPHPFRRGTARPPRNPFPAIGRRAPDRCGCRTAVVDVTLDGTATPDAVGAKLAALGADSLCPLRRHTAARAACSARGCRSTRPPPPRACRACIPSRSSAVRIATSARRPRRASPRST